ncbi:unnamed protein product [Prunus armeniaca]
MPLARGLLEVVFQMFDIPWVTEGLAICISKLVRSRTKYADDLIRSFLGRSEGSLLWVFGCQRNLAHYPIFDSKRAGFSLKS